MRTTGLTGRCDDLAWPAHGFVATRWQCHGRVADCHRFPAVPLGRTAIVTDTAWRWLVALVCGHLVLVGRCTADGRRTVVWQIKNSWSQKFGNKGFIKVARGIGCAGVTSGNTNTYGDVDDYRCPHNCDLR